MEEGISVEGKLWTNRSWYPLLKASSEWLLAMRRKPCWILLQTNFISCAYSVSRWNASCREKPSCPIRRYIGRFLLQVTVGSGELVLREVMLNLKFNDRKPSPWQYFNEKNILFQETPFVCSHEARSSVNELHMSVSTLLFSCEGLRKGSLGFHHRIQSKKSSRVL